jgi:two-component system response regulator MprA
MEKPADENQELSGSDRQEGLVLVVDDEPVDIEMLRIALRDQPLKIIGTTDPSKVRSLIAKYSPDLLILDLMMPRISGLTILRDLRSKNDAAVPVLVCSAYSANEETVTSLGATWLGKPWDRQKLVRVVSELVTSKHKTHSAEEMHREEN